MSGDLAVVATALGLYAAVVVSPGPSFAIVARMAAAGERRAALGATLGLALAALAYAALALAGLATLLAELPGLARAVAVAGGLTLAWIGVGIWRGASAPLPKGGPDASRFATGLLSGALVCLTNPKAIAFFTGIFAAAVPLGTAASTKAAILVGVLVLELGWYGAVALALARPGPRAAYARLRRPAERALGAGLVTIGVVVALGGVRQPVLSSQNGYATLIALTTPVSAEVVPWSRASPRCRSKASRRGRWRCRCRSRPAT